MTKDYDIEEYGARPDGTTMNTKAIQGAIDECSASGGGRVVCGPGSYLTGSLLLKSGVELHLANGCRLIGSESLEDYEAFEAGGFRPENAPERCTESLIRGIDAHNIAITGPGEVNGSGLAFYDINDKPTRFFRKPPTPRPRMVMLYRCRDVRIEDAAFVDSPCWTFWLMKCERVQVHGARIWGDQRMINNDGIDLDSCRDVTVSDCIIKTGDDCLVLRAIQQMFDEPSPCENVAITNCVLDSWCQGIRVGCPSDGTIKNCTFDNLTIKENLRMAGYTLQKSEREERIWEVLDIFPILKDYVDETVKVLSGGMRQMLAMGIALMRRPKLMMFDEPTANLAPNLAEEVLNKILEIEDKFGITVVMVEQNARMVLETCDTAYLMINGRPRYAGDAKKLLENPRFGQIFLGIEQV